MDGWYDAVSILSKQSPEQKISPFEKLFAQDAHGYISNVHLLKSKN